MEQAAMKKHQDAQIAARYTSAMDHDAKVQKKENGGQTATTSSFGSEGGGNIDVAAQYADHFADSGDTYSAKEEQRLRWKLDFRLVPLLWFNVTLGAMDKVTTATAALYNFRQDTGLDGDKYSWVGSAFYVSTAC